ncbi:MAG: penicillin-binding protein 1B [Gammaproteobacteria bacterium]|nr:penicillin-binding protein 1B [Gammaproteobacteria bacterium]
MSRKSRKHRKTSNRQSGRRRGLLRSLLPSLFLALILAGSITLLYIDAQVRAIMDGEIDSEPSHVYARPLTIGNGDPMSLAHLARKLDRFGYHKTNQISQPGDYSIDQKQADLFIRKATNETIPGQSAIPVRIQTKNDQVVSIRNLKTGQALSTIALESPMIGTLQIGPHQDRIQLKLHQMPEILVHALLIMEDHKFSEHHGVDLKAILRAAVTNLISGKAVQGGSTITQQLVKNLFLSPEKTIKRKIKEAVYALVIEWRYSKTKILETYLNEVFLGQSGHRAIHGFPLASEFYFGRPIWDLRPHEVALLVGIIAAPSYYNPHRNPERALQRRNLTLNRMTEFGTLTPEAVIRYKNLPIGVTSRTQEKISGFPAYFDFLQRYLRLYYSEEILRTSGLDLHTTLDLDIQYAAQHALSQTLDKLEISKKIKSGTLQGAVIVVEPASGNILAVIGDRWAQNSGFNRATDIERQIGSLVKPAVYLTALKSSYGYTLASRLPDKPISLILEDGNRWSPKNYNEEYQDSVPLYQALAHSYNLPAVHLGMAIGIDNIIHTLNQLGLVRDIKPYPSVLLGSSQHNPLEMAQMYQAIANSGSLIPLRGLTQISNSKGETIARFSIQSVQTVPKTSARLVHHVLSQSVQFGTASRLGWTFPKNLRLAGKTGTTNQFRDSWFAGYSGNLLAVVWVGRDDNRPIGLTGSNGAMRVWEELMGNLDLTSTSKLGKGDLRYVQIDSENGLLASNECETRINLPFIPGTQPTSYSSCVKIVHNNR